MAAAKGTKPPAAGMGRVKGVPNKATAEIKALARMHGPAAIARLVELAGLAGPAKAAQIEATQVSAIKELLDRGYGKATQKIAGDADDVPIRTVTEIVLRGVRADDHAHD